MPAKRTAPDWTFAPLHRGQIIEITKLAKAAFEEECAAGRAVIPAGVSRSAALDTWRRGQQELCVKRSSLTMCNQGHFRKLKAHFTALLSDPAAAAVSFSNFMRTGKVKESAATDDTHEARELWMHKLEEALTEFHTAHAYAAAICRNQYKCTLTAATAEQLRRLFFTVRARGLKKERAAASAPAPAGDHPF